MQSTIPILSALACGCLITVIARLRSRQRTREKRLADSFAAAVRADRI
jgi:hypothetical protein